MKYKNSVVVEGNYITVTIHDNDIKICEIDFNKQHIENLGNRYDVDNNNFVRFATSDLEQAIFSVLYKAQEAIGLVEFKRNLDKPS